jgi:hypothetical protein
MASLSNLSRPVVVIVRPVAHCIIASRRVSHLSRNRRHSAGLAKGDLQDRSTATVKRVGVGPDPVQQMRVCSLMNARPVD